MKTIVRLIVGAWAAVSIAVGVLAFAVVNGTSHGNIGAALSEAFETIPEAVMISIGMESATLVATIAYWLALLIALYLAFRPNRRA